MRNLLAAAITALLFIASPSLAELINGYPKVSDAEQYPSASLRRMSGLLEKYNARATLTCDKFPQVCRVKGSPGPDCCGKQCLNVMTDGLNCGECGRRCQYGELCCGGSCVNGMNDHKNCGACRNRCAKGSSCMYGMCGYA